MSNVMRIDFGTGCFNSDNKIVKGTERDMTVLFNKTVINADEVRELIHSGMYEYDDRIIVTTPVQADNLRGDKYVSKCGSKGSLSKMKNEKDMMEGNINRMFVTDDITELCNMYTYAKERLDVLFKENAKRIIN